MQELMKTRTLGNAGGLGHLSSISIRQDNDDCEDAARADKLMLTCKQSNLANAAIPCCYQ